MSRGSEGPVRFGPFEADLRSGELRKEGHKLRLGEQPFSVLALLVAKPGELITREEIQAQLWPADTYVDFDRGLNKAVNRLREALGDAADAPRYIETLPKRGYRFIGTLETSAPPEIPATVPEQASRRSPREWAALSRAALSRAALSWAALSWAALGWAAAALVLTAIVFGGYWVTRGRGVPDDSPGPLIRSSLLPPPGQAFVPYSLALSRDGTHLAFVAEAAEGTRTLWIRAMAATTAVPIGGTEGASLPFWSPDRRQVGFFADRLLKIVDVGSGVIRVLADARRPSGATWNTGDAIVFAPDVNGPLYRVSARGGTPVPVTRLPAGSGLYAHRWPVFLPDDRQFLFVAIDAAARSDNAPQLRIGALDQAESTPIEWPGARSVAYALDHLIYVRDGALQAQRFDPVSRRTNGPPIPVAAAELAGLPAFYPATFAVSMNGVLVFQASADLPSRVMWLDAQGREQGTLPALAYGGPAISPDGRLVAGACEGPRRATSSICVFDLSRGVTSRLTDGPDDRFPVWSADGRELAYTTGADIYRVRADGSGAPALVSSRGIPTGWTPDGRILSFGSQNGVVSLALSSPGTRAVTELGEGAEGQLSPTARWLAYVGRGGLMVQAFPDPTIRVTIANDGPAQPRWSRDGRQLFYIRKDKKLMVADFDAASATAGSPRVLTQTRIVGAALVGFQYDVAPDGRFLVNALVNQAPPLTFLSGWTAILRR